MAIFQKYIYLAELRNERSNRKLSNEKSVNLIIIYNSNLGVTPCMYIYCSNQYNLQT